MLLRQAISTSSAPSTHALRRSLVASLLTEGPQILRSSAQRAAVSAAVSYRLQSSLCSSTTPTQQHQLQQRHATRRVDPSVRQRRPHANGEAIAFHVRDLLRQEPAATAPPPMTATATESKPKKEYDSDLVVILDMDECMIHSLFLSNPMADKSWLTKFKLGGVTKATATMAAASVSVVDHFRIQLPAGDHVHVNIRPGLPEFLQDITSRYETHIFTAAMPIYADPILDNFDPDGTKFAARWYRQHCSWDERRNAYVKDLSTLPLPNMKRTVLVDNNPLSFLSHPSNGILVSSFFNDPKDTTLSAVNSLLSELEPHDDVRPVLERRFGLKEALVDIEKNMKQQSKQ
eukprot:CAMPEP_0168787234 /NCGR_PEP_ID=MMETSP0725-20121227/11692_1 /TAXON_ID=265536 /ORGANISM="Amphiprora sp., Strain CCMP467" /LENGTH=345 /DNA_ID=CAMNT_0008837427 /DNA_START=247 /DNA_END=1285 /DNA_ORIENTATION=-